MKLSDIPVIGRSTQGVRIMKIAEGDKIASVALLPNEADGIADETQPE